MKKYKVRTYVLSMPGEMWEKYRILYGGEHYYGTTTEFLSAIGLPGGLSVRCNKEEDEFFKCIHYLNRTSDNPIVRTKNHPFEWRPKE